MSQPSTPRRAVSLLAVATLVATSMLLSADPAALATPLASAPAAPAAPATTASATACDDEAAKEGSQVIQQVDLPTSRWDGKWAYDTTAQLGAFDRVGYCLELGKQGTTQSVFTSMQAFTTDPSRLGLPTAVGDIRRQRVSDLHVWSTAANVPSGDHPQGYIEMWSTDFDPAASGQVPGASATTYDADDRPSATGTYGSFQVHAIGTDLTDATTPATVLAVNGWNNSSFTLDLGIGTSTSSNPDWTFAHNAATLSTRRLTVYARPALVTLEESPQNLRLYPSGSDGTGDIAVSGRVSDAVTALHLQVRPEGEAQWATSTVDIAQDGSFSGHVPIPAELRNREARLVAVTSSGERTVGHWNGLVAGTVVVLQGQSNAEAIGMTAADQAAANSHASEWVRSFGSPEQNAVLSGAEQTWNYAQGNRGSIGDKRWNAGHVGMWGVTMGDELARETGVPVAVINGAKGGQVIEYFARNTADRGDLTTNYGRLYNRMRNAGLLNQVDALLFYQGESDHDRAVAHVEGFGGLLEGWTHDFAREANAGNIDYYAFQVRSSCAAATVGITLREAQRTLPTTFPDYRLKTLSTTGVPRHDGCHYPFAGGYESIAGQVSGVLLRDLFDRDGGGYTAPNPQSVTGSATSSVVELQLQDADDSLRISGDPSGDFALVGSPARITRVTNAGGGLLRLTLDGPLGAGATALTYYGHVGTGPTIATNRDVGLMSFDAFPLTMDGAPAATATLASLSLDGTPLTGFDPATTTYEVTSTGGAPVVAATASDPQAGVEVRVTPERIDIRVTSSDGNAHTTYTIWLQRSSECAVTAPWAAAGWGSPQASSACQTGDSSFTLGDANAGLWTNADGLTTVYRPDALGVGDGFDVLLAAQGSEVNPDSRSGIIVRNDLSHGASQGASLGYANLSVSPRSGAFMQSDGNGDGWIDTEGAKLGDATAPTHLRVVRETVDTLVAHVRATGEAQWRRAGSVTLRGADPKLDVGVFGTANRASGAQESFVLQGAALWPRGAEPVSVDPPTIEGKPAAGTQLRAVVGATDPTGADLTFQWLRDGRAIPGATDDTHVVSHEDSGSALAVQVTASEEGRTSGSAVSDPVEVGLIPSADIGWVEVQGHPRPGETLTAATTATPGDATVTYQWLRDGEPLPGATAPTRIVSGGDAGHVVSVRATATSVTGGVATVTSPASAVSALLAAWTFDDVGDGGVMVDTTGGGRDLQTDAGQIDGPINAALQLTGTTGATPTGPQLAAALAGAPAATVSAWIRPTDLDGGGTREGNWVLGTRIDQGAAGIDVNFVGRQLRVAGRSTASDPYTAALFDYPDDGRWHHVSARLDWAGDTIRVWIDAVEQPRTGGSAVITFGADSYTPGTPTQRDGIGISPARAGAFTGGLDELRIQAGVLSEDQLRELATPHAPAASVAPVRAPDQGSWYRSAPDLAFSLSVPLPPIVGIEYRVGTGEWTPLDEGGPQLEDGVTSIEARSTVGEDRGQATSVMVSIDSVPPTVEVGEVPGEDRTQRVLTVSASDNTSAVAGSEFSVDGAEWQPYTAPVLVVGVGTHTLRARATDNAGNTSEEVSHQLTLTDGGGNTDPADPDDPDRPDAPVKPGSPGNPDQPGNSGNTGSGVTPSPSSRADGKHADLARTGVSRSLATAVLLGVLLSGAGATALVASRRRGGERP